MHVGSGGEEALGIGVTGVEEEVAGGGGLDNVAVLHDGDAVGDLADDGEVVGDEEHGEVMSAAEVVKEGEDLRLDGDVEGGSGLVGNEETGPVDEGHGNEDALALTAGELVGVVAVAVGGVGKGHVVHGGEDAVADGGTAQVWVVGLEGFGDLGADGHDRVEGGHGLLEDHGDVAAAVAAHGGFGEGEEVCAVEVDAACDGCGGGEEAKQGEGGGGFAGAGFSDEAQGFARGDREGDAVNRESLVEGDG